MNKNKYIVLLVLLFTITINIGNVFAAAGVQTELPGENFFNNEFVNVLTADDVPSEWKFSGSWSYGNANYINGTGWTDKQMYTSSEYDLTSGFEATFKFAMQGNNIRLHVGNDAFMEDSQNTGFYMNVTRVVETDRTIFYLDLYENGEKVAGGEFGNQWVYYGAANPMIISLTCLQDGNVSVKLVKSDGSYTELCTHKTDAPITKGKVGLRGLAAPLYVYSVKLDKLSNTVSTDKFLLDKTFTSQDTTETLSRAGWQRTTDKDGYMTLTDDGILYSKSSGYFTDEVGISMSKYTFSGNYTFSFKSYKYFGDTIIKFNQTGDSYYKITHNSDFKLEKIVNDSSTVIFSATEVIKKTTWCNSVTSVSLDNDENGNLIIAFSVQTPSDNYSDSYTDKDNPLKSGMISTGGINNGKFIFKEIKVYPTGESSDKEEVYTAEYYINDAKAESLSTGEIELDFPVVMLGDNMITLSVAYSGNTMIDCNMGTIYDYMQGRNKLFELSDCSEDTYIITYFIESFDTLTELMDFKILN